MKNIDQKKIDKIFKENVKTAEELAYCYYQSLLDEYKDHMKKDSKENIGFNAFVDGIRLGLDISLSMVDNQTKKAIKEKIKSMIQHRKEEEMWKKASEIIKKYNIKSNKKKVSS
jgi:hypothetical protein